MAPIICPCAATYLEQNDWNIYAPISIAPIVGNQNNIVSLSPENSVLVNCLRNCGYAMSIALIQPANNKSKKSTALYGL